jgi:hypothetical protein
MFAADAQLDVGPGPRPRSRSHAISSPTPSMVQADERIALEDALVHIGLQEAAGIVAADAEGGLGQVVGAEREELGPLRPGRRPSARRAAVRSWCRPDSPASPALLGEHGLRGAVGQLAQDFISAWWRPAGCMISGTGASPPSAATSQRRLEDGADLHLVDFGEGDAQAAAAMAQHRVEFVQFPPGASAWSAPRPIVTASSANSSSLCGRNSCSGGSSRRIVTGRPAMTSNISTKSARCSGSELGQRRRGGRPRRRRGSSRARRRCGRRRRTCARCGTGRCPRPRTGARCGIQRRLGIGAHLHAAALSAQAIRVRSRRQLRLDGGHRHPPSPRPWSRRW